MPPAHKMYSPLAIVSMKKTRLLMLRMVLHLSRIVGWHLAQDAADQDGEPRYDLATQPQHVPRG